MPTIPTHHSVGDTGHTTDHNSIVDVLTDHEQRVTTLQTAQSGYMVKTGGNVVTLANPSGISEQVIIPSGVRDNTAAVAKVIYGGVQTYALDPYGHLRMSAADVGSVPAEVSGFSNSQLADLTRWRKAGSAGAIVSRVDKDGNVYAPNLTPTTWTGITMAAGLGWHSALGARPQYRLVGDMVELRGLFHKADSSPFTVSPTDIGTLPPGAAPPYGVYTMAGAQFVSGQLSVRMEIMASGLMRFYFQAPGYAPNWASLDGIRFSRLA